MISNTFWSRSGFWIGAFLLLAIAAAVALWQASNLETDQEAFTVSKGDVVSSLIHTTAFRNQGLEIKAAGSGQLNMVDTDNALTPKALSGEQTVAAGVKLAEIKGVQTVAAATSVNTGSAYWRGQLNIAEARLHAAEARYQANPIPENAYAYDDAIRAYNQIARAVERTSVASISSASASPASVVPVISPAAGVIEWKVANGSQVKTGDVVAVLKGQQIEAELPLSENDKKTLVGKKVIVEAGSEVVKGQIVDVTEKGVLLNLEKSPAGEAFEGRIEVVFDVREGVLALRKDLLKFEEGKWFAEVKGEGRKEVQVGLVGNEYIEIVSGLEEGSVVTTPELSEMPES